MRKILSIFIISMLGLFCIGASSPMDTIQKEVDTQLLQYRTSLDKENELLVQKLQQEQDETILKEIKGEIESNIFAGALSMKVEDYYESGNRFKATVKVKNQCNIKTMLTYNTRVKQLEEQYSQREEVMPVMSELACLKETIDLNKDKATSFNIEIYGTNVNGELELDEIDFGVLTKAKVIKSFLF